MSDHFGLSVDRFITAETVESLPVHEIEKPSGEGFSSSSSEAAQHQSTGTNVAYADDHGFTEGDEEEPLILNVECRICQEEDSITNLETPCACSGSLKYAHRKCVQHWCNEKGDITCEICHQPYKPGYTAPPPAPEDATIDISEGWTLTGAPLDLRDPRILAMAAAERRFLEADFDEYTDSNANGAAFCRSAALILMALLLLRHALYLNNGEDEDDDAATFFSLFLLRAAGFLLPCYIMAWAISILQRRRQRQEAAALAANEVAFMIQAASPHGVHITVEPGPAVIPQHQLPEPQPLRS